MRDLDILAVGEVNVDIVVGGLATIPGFGDPEMIVDAVSLTVGSSTAIFACGAARLGARTAMYGVAGDDALGRYMVDAMRERGVDVTGVRLDPGLVTGATVVLSGDDAAAPVMERAQVTAMGSIGAMDVAAIPPELVARTRHVHSGSFFLQERSRARLPAFFGELRARGVTTSFDTNGDPSQAWATDVHAMLRNADLFLPNAGEATSIARRDDVEAAAFELARIGADGRDDGGPWIVVKLGAGGALAARAGGDLHRVAALPVIARDATGAGDSFDAGFVTAWLEGRPIDECLRWGAVCGAWSVQRLGGVDGQPTRLELQAVLSAWPAAAA